MKRYQIMAALLLLGVLLAACGGAGDLDSPPQIRYGQDACDRCKMIINEPRFASAYTTDTGDARRFDDIGGMFLHAVEQGDNVHIFWVHDFNSEDWIEAPDATYVHDPDLTTPMGWGVAAFADDDGATAYAAEHGGDLLSYDELREQVESGELMPPGMMDHNHDHEASQMSGTGEHAE